jgi:hypothetical protein
MQFHSHILVELENPLDPKRNARRKLEHMMVKNTPKQKDHHPNLFKHLLAIRYPIACQITIVANISMVV